MSALFANTTASVMPCMSYRDAPAAIKWLCETFGLSERVVYRDDAGTIIHAELTFGNGMIMLGGIRDSEYGRLVRQPDQMNGHVTQSVYLITQSPDEIYRRARAADARILIDIKDEDYGSRGFTCADLEGHVWTFGTYDPWKTQVSADSTT
jgi:uncharacterized glyoxalase superfamily protein PhnB